MRQREEKTWSKASPGPVFTYVSLCFLSGGTVSLLSPSNSVRLWWPNVTVSILKAVSVSRKWNVCALAGLAWTSATWFYDFFHWSKQLVQVCGPPPKQFTHRPFLCFSLEGDIQILLLFSAIALMGVTTRDWRAAILMNHSEVFLLWRVGETLKAPIWLQWISTSVCLFFDSHRTAKHLSF